MRIKDPSNNWATPRSVFNLLPEISDFDPCPLFADFDGLELDWVKEADNGLVFVNPPYSSKTKTAFVKKAYEESCRGLEVALLIPAATSTKLFHELIQPFGKIQFLNFRPKFEGINSKLEYVNYGLGRNTQAQVAIREQYQYLPRVSSAGAHDSMLVYFGLEPGSFPALKQLCYGLSSASNTLPFEN